ncbi:MAG: helix-turn-helix domain-containing protein [Planctomycetota bacterium]
MDTPNPSDWITTEEVADLLGISLETMKRLRDSGKGPTVYRISDRIFRYKKSDVLDFLQEIRIVPYPDNS